MFQYLPTSFSQSRKGCREAIPALAGSLSYWLKDIPLKPEYKKKFYTKQIINLSMGAKSQK